MKTTDVTKIEDGLMSVKEGDRILLAMDNKEEDQENWLFVYNPGSGCTSNREVYAAAIAFNDKIKPLEPTSIVVPVYISWSDESYVQGMLISHDGSIVAPIRFHRSVDRVLIDRSTQ